MIKLAIAGAAGRMGGAIIQAITQGQGDGVKVTTAVEHKASPALGKDAGVLAGGEPLGVEIQSDVMPDGSAADFDLMIEFTTPESTLAHVKACQKLGRGMVIGTTGISEKDADTIRQAAKDIPIVFAANTSVGVNLCVALLETASKVLGAESDIEIIEAHHRHKVDAPSGTALLLGKSVAESLGVDLAKDGVFTRHGNTGERKSGSIGFSTIRGGDIAGEHTVMFIGNGERVEITHKATDRKIFADGAIKAAKWLAKQPPGLYSMRDVLGL